MTILRTKNLKIAVREAVLILKRGGVVAYPTETTYGFGCDPRNKKAVAKIYKIKGREKKKRVLMAASSILQATKVVRFSSAQLKFAKQHWPGSVTMIIGDIAVRVSPHPFVRALAQAFNFPVVSTSANISGEPPCRSGKAIAKIFSERKMQPDLILDFGSLPRRKPSTIVRVSENGEIEVIRGKL